AVRAHVEARHVEGDRLREADDSHLGRRVVRLAEIADQPRGRGEVDVAPALLLAEMEACRLGDVEAAEEMDPDDRLEVGDAHLVEDAVAQDARVVDDAVDAPEGVERAFDDALGPFGLGDAVRARHRLAARASDLPHDGLGRTHVLALTLGTAAEVIDHHLAALGRGEKCDLAADAAAGPGDDDDLALQALLSPHRGFLPFMHSQATGTFAWRWRKRQREADWRKWSAICSRSASAPSVFAPTFGSPAPTRSLRAEGEAIQLPAGYPGLLRRLRLLATTTASGDGSYLLDSIH